MSKGNAGRLVIIGGAEERDGKSEVLREFVRLAGGTRARPHHLGRVRRARGGRLRLRQNFQTPGRARRARVRHRGAGRLISKVGAEGVYCAGVLPCESWPRGLGLAFKIEDGDKADRARPRAAVEALRQLGVLGEGDLSSLSKFTRTALTNHRGDEVGEARPAFTLSLDKA